MRSLSQEIIVRDTRVRDMQKKRYALKTGRKESFLFRLSSFSCYSKRMYIANEGNFTETLTVLNSSTAQKNINSRIF